MIQRKVFAGQKIKVFACKPAHDERSINLLVYWSQIYDNHLLWKMVLYGVHTPYDSLAVYIHTSMLTYNL